MKRTILTFLLGAASVIYSYAQEPSLKSKDISSVKQLTGDKMIYEQGWQEVNVSGTASVVSNAILIKCDSNEFYSFRAVPRSKLAFNPTGDFTVEFKVKVVNNVGRGLDVVFRTRDFLSPTIFFSHKYVGVANPKQTITKIKENEFHIYRLAVSKSEKKIYVYADGKYVGTADSFSDDGGSPALTFGKGHRIGKSEIYIDYISFDLTGAFKPL